MDASSLEKATMEINPENGDKECQAEGSFSGKVSVSVVDAGETAVVVSLVEGSQWIPVSSEKRLSPPEASENSMTESRVSISDAKNHQSNTEKPINSPREQQELELSLSHNVVCSLSSNTWPDDLKKDTHGERSDPSNLSGTKISNGSHERARTSRNGSDMGLHLGLSVGSFLCGNICILFSLWACKCFLSRLISLIRISVELTPAHTLTETERERYYLSTAI